LTATETVPCLLLRPAICWISITNAAVATVSWNSARFARLPAETFYGATNQNLPGTRSHKSARASMNLFDPPKMRKIKLSCDSLCALDNLQES